MPNLRRLYFAHSYEPRQRRFNERIWRILMDRGFVAWIDRGLELGTGGRRYPMDVSFNEWMMSRCDGFVAVVPRSGSRYLELEHRLALRMGLPTLVIGAEGAAIGTGALDYAFPESWGTFLSAEVSAAIEKCADDLSRRVESARDWRFGANAASRRLAVPSAVKIALLPPGGGETHWVAAHATISAKCTANLLLPMNFRQPRDLIADLDGDYNFLVIDVGVNGTPREMLGYLEAHGIPLVRVCYVSEADSQGVAKLQPTLDREQRRPYVRLSAQDADPALAPEVDPPSLSTILSPLTDGLQGDPGMRPVLFWSSAAQLSERILALVNRIKAFQAGFDEGEGPLRLDLETHRQARDYFAPPLQANSVFLSFAGDGDYPEAAQQKLALADHLAAIFRFSDLRFFHYKGKDSEGRLESGALINQGLQKRVEEADEVVVLYDQAYLRSKYCMDELRQAIALRASGLLTVRAYRLSASPAPDDAFEGMNVFEHRGTWGDASLKELVVENVQDDCAGGAAALRDAEAKRVKEWLADDGRQTGKQLRRVLLQAGLSEGEVDELGIDWNEDAASCLARLLKSPQDKSARRRHRAIVTLLLAALATGDSGRLRLVNRWVRERSLVGRPPQTVITFEQVIDVPDSVAPVDLTQNAAVIGERIGQVLKEVLRDTNPVVLRAGNRAAEIPVEWARENAATDAICFRRPLRWRLPQGGQREALIEELPSRALPPRWLLMALLGDDINPEDEISQLAETVRRVYRERDWPPELVDTIVCRDQSETKARLLRCSHEIVHIAGHIGGASLRVASGEIPSDTLGQWLADSNVRLLVLNGCEGARPRSPLALHSVATADRVVQLGKVPEVVAHRLPLTDNDGIAFANTFGRAFAKGFDVVSACFEARRAGSERLSLSPVVISQRMARTA